MVLGAICAIGEMVGSFRSRGGTGSVEVGNASGGDVTEIGTCIAHLHATSPRTRATICRETFGAEFVPVVSIVADEVGDFTKSLVRYGHVLV